MKWLILIVVLTSFWLYAFTAVAKTQLTLDYRAEVQVKVGDIEGDQWNTVTSMKGPISGTQFFLEPQKVYRLKLTARKPHDIKGTFKVRTPTRVDGVVAPFDTNEVAIILGPHIGCPSQANRCKPLTLNDVGNVELRLDLEEAEQTSLGIFLLRPYDVELDLAYRPALTYKNKGIMCGDKVKKGFWIFARRFHGNSNPLNTISLCVKNPKGKINCVKDGEYELKSRARKRGLYEFTTWNKGPLSSTCFIKAE